MDRIITPIGIASLAVAVVAIGFAVAAPEARAQSAQCGALVAELNGLNARAGGGGGGDAAKFRGRVAGLEKRSRANGCAGASKFGQPQQCAGILAQLSNARSQLAAAEARGGGGGGLTKAQQARRGKLQAQVAKLRCGQAPPAPVQQQAAPRGGNVPVASAPSQSDRGQQQQQYIVHGSGRLVAVQPSAQGIGQGGLLSLLFGGGTRRQQPAPTGTPTTLTTLTPEHRITGLPSESDSGPSYSRVSFGGGAYRTLCVRKCDGYYFPISTVTYRGNFLRDEMVCKALCPGTDVGLYAHPSGSESEAMHAISDGLSYAALPTAYQYRRSFDPACTCAFEAKMITVAGGEQVIDVAAYSPAATSDAAAAIEAATTPVPASDAVVTETVSEATVSETGGAVAAATSALSVAEDGTVVDAASTVAATPAVATETPATAAATTALIEPARAAPQGTAIPIDTKPPIRVRTIGPTFLQAQ